MNDWRSAAVLGTLAMGLVVASTLAPREPPRAHLLEHPNPTSSGPATSVSAAQCATLYEAKAPFEQSPTGIDARYLYEICGPTTLDDTWLVEVRAQGAARWRVTGREPTSCEGARCVLEVGPWESVAAVALDGAGRPVARPALVIGYARSWLNLRVRDVVRLGLAFVVGALLLLWMARAPSPWVGQRAELALIGCAIVAGGLAAARPEAWGGADGIAAAVGFVMSAVVIVAGARMWAPRARGPIDLALGIVVVAAMAMSLEAAVVHERWPYARELQRVVIVSVTTWSALVAVSGRGAASAWLMGTLFGLGAVTLEALTRSPMPYPGLFGAYKPWDLVSAAWPIGAIAFGLARVRAIDARPASWTRRVSEPLARLSRGEDEVASRAALERALGARRVWPVPNVATAGFVFALGRVLSRSIATRPPVEIARRSASLVLFDTARALAVRGEVGLASEPRAALFHGERALEVRDRDRPATPSLVSAVRAVLDAVDARVGSSGLALERVHVRFDHPGDELVGRSFELALGIAWYGLRTGAAPDHQGLLATGRLAPDRDSVLAVDHLADKLRALTRGEIILVPLAQSDVAREVADLVVLDAAALGPWRTRRRARSLARDGARVVVLVPTLGLALRVAIRRQVT